MLFNDGTNSFVRHAKFSGQLSKALATVMSFNYLTCLVWGKVCGIGLFRPKLSDKLGRNQRRKYDFVTVEE
ncbi:MAG: hypothetical protein BGO39_03310 [Chloroflexi bacterium 54-19]|nr:MAG: hypothetical protein BGO39_03310 [Chloroflexi bacterium 54-19]